MEQSAINGGGVGAQFRLAQAEGEIVATADPTAITAPSGQVLTLQDVVWTAPGPEGLTLRFRFIAPQIAEEGGTVGFDAAAEDMLWLCQTYALPRVPATGPQPQQIVISLSDRALPFGQAAPEATQFFEAYGIENGECIWNVF